jgi:hypothetical protein
MLFQEMYSYVHMIGCHYLAVFISVYVDKVPYAKAWELLMGRLCFYVHLANMLSGAVLNSHCVVLHKKSKENRIEICTLLCRCPNFLVQFQGYTTLFINCFAYGTCNFGIKFHGTFFESLLHLFNPRRGTEELAGEM